MARFKVRNNRPAKTLVIDGRTLRAARRSRGVPAGEMWLDAERFMSRQINKLLKMKRLVVVDCEDTTMSSLEEYLERFVYGDEVLEDFVEEPVQDEPPAPPENTGPPEPEAPVPEPPPAAEPAEPLSEPDGTEDRDYGKDELSGMHYRNELQPLAKRLGLPANGSKDEIVARILEHQGAS